MDKEFTLELANRVHFRKGMLCAIFVYVFVSLFTFCSAQRSSVSSASGSEQWITTINVILLFLMALCAPFCAAIKLHD